MEFIVTESHHAIDCKYSISCDLPSLCKSLFYCFLIRFKIIPACIMGRITCEAYTCNGTYTTFTGNRSCKNWPGNANTHATLNKRETRFMAPKFQMNIRKIQEYLLRSNDSIENINKTFELSHICQVIELIW